MCGLTRVNHNEQINQIHELLYYPRKEETLSEIKQLLEKKQPTYEGKICCKHKVQKRNTKGQWGLGSRSDRLWGGEEFIALRRHEVENSSSQESTPSRWNMASVMMMSSLMTQQLLTVIKKAFGQVKMEFSFKTLKDFYSLLQFLASIWRWTCQQWCKLCWIMIFCLQGNLKVETFLLFTSGDTSGFFLQKPNDIKPNQLSISTSVSFLIQVSMTKAHVGFT